MKIADNVSELIGRHANPFHPDDNVEGLKAYHFTRMTPCSGIVLRCGLLRCNSMILTSLTSCPDIKDWCSWSSASYSTLLSRLHRLEGCQLMNPSMSHLCNHAHWTLHETLMAHAKHLLQASLPHARDMPVKIWLSPVCLAVL